LQEQLFGDEPVMVNPAGLPAETVLAAHIAIILFNLFGLIAVPIGAVRGWHFVHVAWWRVLHVVLLAAVAAQAIVGRACILTLWQSDLAGAGGSPAPLIMSLVDRLIFWKLPIWVFAALYAAVFGYAVALLWLVPLRRTR
jgi:Protein of Unknown function (DUF2784)